MSGLLISALAVISALTSLTVEAIKKISKKELDGNILAVVSALIITIIGSVLYIVYNSLSVTPQVIVIVIALAYLSFLSASCGYDKIKRLLEQIGGK